MTIFKRGLAAACLIGLASAPALLAAPRSVTVTADSARGWMPSERLEREARDSLAAFFKADARGDDAGIWAMLTPGMQGSVNMGTFKATNQKRRKESGKLKTYKVQKMTWTKDGLRAPRPGIYVALDFAAISSKSARQCGNIVLYKATEAEPFRIARTEYNYLPDATYELWLNGNSKAEADQIWTALSAYCSNYKPIH